MSQIFNLENPFWRTMSKLGDMIILNIIWFVCCIPIITIGPSTIALYYVMLKLVRDEEGAIVKQFFRSFKQNFKQGTIVGLIMTAVGVILGFDVLFYREASGAAATPLWWITVMMFVAFLMIWTYIFPFIAKFENTIKRSFMFSFYMSIRHLGKTIVMLLVTAGCILLMYYVFPPFLLMFMGVISYLNSKLLVGIFDSYIPEEKRSAQSQYDQGFDKMEQDSSNQEEPVHIVMDIDNPEHVVLGDADSIKGNRE